MSVWLEISDAEINRSLNTIGERVSFQIIGTVAELQDEIVDVTSYTGEAKFLPGSRRARIWVDTIKRTNEAGE